MSITVSSAVSTYIATADTYIWSNPNEVNFVSGRVYVAVLRWWGGGAGDAATVSIVTNTVAGGNVQTWNTPVYGGFSGGSDDTRCAISYVVANGTYAGQVRCSLSAARGQVRLHVYELTSTYPLSFLFSGANVSNANAATYSTPSRTFPASSVHILGVGLQYSQSETSSAPSGYSQTVTAASWGFNTYDRVYTNSASSAAVTGTVSPSDSSIVVDIAFSEDVPAPGITSVDSDDIITQGQQNIIISVANLPTGMVPIRAGAGGTNGIGGTDFTGFVATPGGTAGSFTIECDVPIGIATSASTQCYVEYAPS